MPFFDDDLTFEEPHVRQPIFAPAQQGSWFAELRPVPIRHTHPRKNEPPLTWVTCEILNTQDFEVFYKHVVPLLEVEKPALEDAWPASRWGHPIGEDARNMTHLTHKEIRDHFQAKICREERMAPDHMLGMRAGLAPPPPSVAEHTMEQRAHLRALMEINTRFDVSGAILLTKQAATNEMMIAMGILNPLTLILAIQLSPFGHLFSPDPSDHFLVQGSTRHQFIFVSMAILSLSS